MTITAHLADIMFGWVDAGYVIPATGRHNEFGMAADAKLTAPVDRQLFRIVGMIQRRTMTVFAWNHGMLSAAKLLDLVIVALIAVLGFLVLCRVVFPFLLIAQAVVPKGITTFL